MHGWKRTESARPDPADPTPPHKRQADSQAVNTARICIAEAGLQDEVEFVNHEFKLVWSEEWRKHQPFNQMPYMLNNETGWTIYESRAIAKCE